jgi:phage FluMu protein Com
MKEKLLEVRCPKCPPIVRGALLFKAAGDAVIETKCPRCGEIVKIKVEKEAIINVS